MKVDLIAFTSAVDDLDEPGWGLWGADKVCDVAAATCVSEDIPATHHYEDTYLFWEDEECRHLRAAMASGHESVAEHASFTFAIEGISRACSHQLVRHRIGASFSQQSQRFVQIQNMDWYVTPDSVDEHNFINDYCYIMSEIMDLYERLIEAGVPEEDARYILPNACCTNLVVTVNARELRHMAEERMCARAQWEIRELVTEMVRLAKKAAPVLFADAGPKCDRLGYCPERRGSCGRHPGREV